MPRTAHTHHYTTRSLHTTTIPRGGLAALRRGNPHPGGRANARDGAGQFLAMAPRWGGWDKATPLGACASSGRRSLGTQGRMPGEWTCVTLVPVLQAPNRLLGLLFPPLVVCPALG